MRIQVRRSQIGKGPNKGSTVSKVQTIDMPFKALEGKPHLAGELDFELPPHYSLDKGKNPGETYTPKISGFQHYL